MKRLLFLFAIILLVSSCTDNVRARKWGGTETVKLEPNEEFVNITWKENDLWIIVKDKNTGKFYAREKSSMGILEGRINIE